jgi:hypothetical protein
MTMRRLSGRSTTLTWVEWDEDSYDLFPVVRNSSKSLRSRGLKCNEYYSLTLRLCAGRYSQEYIYRNKDEIELQDSADSLEHSERT